MHQLNIRTFEERDLDNNFKTKIITIMDKDYNITAEDVDVINSIIKNNGDHLIVVIVLGNDNITPQTRLWDSSDKGVATKLLYSMKFSTIIEDGGNVLAIYRNKISRKYPRQELKNIIKCQKIFGEMLNLCWTLSLDEASDFMDFCEASGFTELTPECDETTISLLLASYYTSKIKD